MDHCQVGFHSSLQKAFSVVAEGVKFINFIPQARAFSFGDRCYWWTAFVFSDVVKFGFTVFRIWE
jgi:hypothetical protein